MREPEPSRNDPNPQQRKGDSSFLPVVIAAAIAVIVILVAALIFLKARQSKTIPATNQPHPTSRFVMPYTPPPLQPQPHITA
jgi:hypothetical protein